MKFTFYVGFQAIIALESYLNSPQIVWFSDLVWGFNFYTKKIFFLIKFPTHTNNSIEGIGSNSKEIVKYKRKLSTSGEKKLCYFSNELKFSCRPKKERKRRRKGRKCTRISFQIFTTHKTENCCIFEIR